jgi:hypothetical protein
MNTFTGFFMSAGLPSGRGSSAGIGAAMTATPMSITASRHTAPISIFLFIALVPFVVLFPLDNSQ